MVRARIALLFGLLALCGCLACGEHDTGSAPAIPADGSRDAGLSVPPDSTGPPPGGQHPAPFALPPPLAIERTPTGGTFDPSSGWLECPPQVDEHGAVVTRRYRFHDGTGAPQSAYGEETTASIDLSFTLEAHPERDGHSGVIRLQHELTVRGLAGDERTRIWSGTITERIEGLPPHAGPGCPGGPGGHGGHGGHGGPGGPGGPRPPDAPAPDSTATPPPPPDPADVLKLETVTIAEVVVPYPLGEETWPLSGTIGRVIRLEGGPGGTRDLESRLTYNGTRYASLIIDGESRPLDLLHPHPLPDPPPPRR